MPTLTIITHCRDDAAHLGRSLAASLAEVEANPGCQLVYVDDASSDASPDIAGRMLRASPADTRAVTLPEWRGTGGAANAGLDAASGDYVWFVDSDDWATPGSVRRILGAAAEAGSPDILLIPYRVLRADGPHDTPERSADTERAARGAVGPWAKVWRRSMGIRYPEGRAAEGVPHHYLLFDAAGSVAAVPGPEPCYVWDRTNAGAISQTTDWCARNSRTLLHLAFSDELVRLGLRDRYVSDNLRNIADMYDLRHRIRKPEVRRAWADRFRAEVQRLYCGLHAH